MTKKLGINGLGRIAKLLLWNEIQRKYFSEIFVNIGRGVGNSLADIAHFIEHDSTYGRLHEYLHGASAKPCITDFDEVNGSMLIDGVKVTFLRHARNPKDIEWKKYGVELVVDATGAFADPAEEANASKGSLRGHFEAGAKKVILSAPFKIKDGQSEMPADAVTTVMGINGETYDPQRHRLISNASCTTTCLSFMIKPLLDHFGPGRILTASMATVHAATGKQPVTDRAPKAKATDLRKDRAVFDNIILTSTGAAKALSLVIPEIGSIGFIAESVRVPITTGSLIILTLTIQDESLSKRTTRKVINGIYEAAQSHYPEGYLVLSKAQNVSSDIVGFRAAAVIEGRETHTRTAEINVHHKGDNIKVPVTSVVIYGWYDNELGSYVNMLGDRTRSIHQLMG
jgi:glyceraldehyde 3-phosphate dehydrogenase